MRDGTFKDVALDAGVAFDADGKARAGMGADGDLDNSGRQSLVVTNFENEMIGLYRETRTGIFEDVAVRASRQPSRSTLGFGWSSRISIWTTLDLVVANGHIDETVRGIRGNVGYALAPHLF